jgi:hypothetical protein
MDRCHTWRFCRINFAGRTCNQGANNEFSNQIRRATKLPTTGEQAVAEAKAARQRAEFEADLPRRGALAGCGKTLPQIGCDLIL